MKKRFFAILSSLFFSFAFFSCNNLTLSSGGSVSVALPKASNSRAASAADASYYEVSLSCINESPSAEAQPVSKKSSAGGTLTFENLEPGTWNIEVFAYNLGKVKIAYRTSTVLVEAGVVSDAAVTVKSLDSDSFYTFTFFTAKLADSSKYLLTDEAPSFDLFTVTETWTNKIDPTNTKTVTGVSSDYKISCETKYVGAVPVTLTYKDKTTTATVNVTYKYTPAKPVISTQPVDASIAASTGSTTLSVTAKGTSATIYSNSTDSTSDAASTTALDTLSYQWYVASADGTTSTTDATGTAIDGATSSKYIVSGITADTSYYCVVTSTPNTTYSTSTEAPTTTSDKATVTITKGTSSISITIADSSDIQVASSTTSGVVTLTADTGYDSYTWFINDAQQTSTENVLTFTPATGVTYDVFLNATKGSVIYTVDIQIQ